MAEFLIVALLAQACATVGTRTATLRFPSLADGTMIDGYLFRADGEARHPAVVLLHGCGGLFSPTTGQMSVRERDWAQRFVAMGYSALLVDSFSPRGIARMCSPETFRQSVFLERSKDAYGALRYLQAQPFVRPDRIAIVGWSQGGGVTLLSVRADSLGRPQDLARGDFRAAVAVYAGAYHDFDWPSMPVQPLPAYRTSRGVVPIVGMDPAARDDALIRVTQFLKARLED